MNVVSCSSQEQIKSILNEFISGKRLTSEKASFLFSADLVELGQAASKIRQQKHPNQVVTFVIDRNISYTNLCTIGCDFCAFHKKPGEAASYILSIDEILEKVSELKKLGGTQVMIQGGVNPEIRLSYLIEMVSAIHSRFPEIKVHSFSAVELVCLAEREKISVEDLLLRLKKAGLNSIPGGGAEILVDRVRKAVSSKKIDAEKWIDFMKTAHRIGFKTTATMVFGYSESCEDRVSHLDRIRTLQDETGGFRSFIPWTLAPRNTPAMTQFEAAGGIDYLKTLAISRLFLDNIPNIQAGWLTEGINLAQVGLAFGANDMGGILIEDKVLEPTGIQVKTEVNDIVCAIQKAGYISAQRDTDYNILKTFSSLT